jgi:hypothetical protein
MNTAAAPLWRRLLFVFTLATFTLQGYIVQTHIHGSPHLAAGTNAAIGKAGSTDPHDKYPANDDPANCPICQEILHTGAFITPAAIALLPPTLAVSTIAIAARELPFIAAVSHDWRGRAPPRI